MSSFFLDTSALVKRYFPEAGSAWITAVTAPAGGHMLVLSAITRVEVAAAFAIKYRSGTATLADRDAAYKLFVLHTVSEYDLAPVTAALLDLAMALTQRQRLRGYDAVQLATALVVNTEYLGAGIAPLTFLSADNDLITAARTEGLSADNPNDYGAQRTT